MANKFIPVGECPECGAPIVAQKEFWEHAEFVEQLDDTLYMKGIIYTCKCHEKIHWNQPLYIPSCQPLEPYVDPNPNGTGDPLPDLPWTTTITWDPEDPVNT